MRELAARICCHLLVGVIEGAAGLAVAVIVGVSRGAEGPEER